MGLLRRFVKIIGIVFVCLKTLLTVGITVRGLSQKARQKAAIATQKWAQSICKAINIKVHVNGNIYYQAYPYSEGPNYSRIVLNSNLDRIINDTYEFNLNDLELLYKGE